MAAQEDIGRKAELVLAQQMAIIALAFRMGHDRRVDRQGELRHDGPGAFGADTHHLPGRLVVPDLLALAEQRRAGGRGRKARAEILRQEAQAPDPDPVMPIAISDEG